MKRRGRKGGMVMMADMLELSFVLARARRSLFRWAAQGKYQDDDAVPLQRGTAGLAVSPELHVATERVWMLADPPTLYQQRALSDVSGLHAAGEPLWLLGEECAMDLGLPDYDFWLVDDEYVVLLHYDAEHALTGGEVLVCAPAVACCRRWRDLALSHSVSVYVAA